MATKPTSTEPIEGGTGRSWEDWLAWLESIGARELDHKEIARRIKAEARITGWWAQYVTIAYEQHIGRRVPGQDHTGSYQVSVTKTLPGTIDEAMAAWERLAGGETSFGGVAVAGAPRSSATPKWRRWGATLADGTRFTASTTEKAPGKTVLAVGHEKLASLDEVERWRAFWKDYLAGL